MEKLATRLDDVILVEREATTLSSAAPTHPGRCQSRRRFGPQRAMSQCWRTCPEAPCLPAV